MSAEHNLKENAPVPPSGEGAFSFASISFQFLQTAVFADFFQRFSFNLPNALSFDAERLPPASQETRFPAKCAGYAAPFPPPSPFQPRFLLAGVLSPNPAEAADVSGCNARWFQSYARESEWYAPDRPTLG